MSKTLTKGLFAWKEICEILGWKTTGGTYRNARKKELSTLCDWIMEGRKIRIKEVYEEKQTKLSSGKYVNDIQTLLLHILASNKDGVIETTIKNLMNLLDIVNDNYVNCYLNRKILSEKTKVDEDYIDEVYSILHSYKRTINNSYKHLPIYKKNKKQWYYPPEWNEEKIICKDYSRGNTISKDEVMELRRLSLFYTDEEIFNMPQRKDCRTVRQLNELINGRLYTWLPYFNKKKQKWIYPDNWEGEKEKELDELPIFKDIFYKKNSSSKTKLTNYQVIQIRVASLYLSPQRIIMEKLNLQDLISIDSIKLILKNKTHLSMPYSIDGQWIYPANFTQKQKEYFPKLVEKIEQELHLKED